MSDPTTGAHPDVDTLSDLEAGLLDGDPAGGRVRAHVAGCASCADLLTLLHDTQAMLAGLPPVTMPADVAGRIDAALAEAAAAGPAADAGAAEPAAEAGAAEPAAVPTGVTVLADQAGRRRRRSGWKWLPGAGAVAAGVAVLFAGAIGFSAIQNQTASKEKSSGAAAGDAGAPRALAPSASGQDYTPTNLGDGVRGLLSGRVSPLPEGAAAPAASGSPSAAADSTKPTMADPAFARLHQPRALAACIAELAGNPTQRPLAVDFARFDGKPALVVVLPDRDPAKVDAWVVGPACRPGHSDRLRFQVVPRVG